jgi:hypothetical protein
MSIPWERVRSTGTINFYNMNDHLDVLFVNCGAWVPAAEIRDFVNQGGTVYASDLALDYIQEAFPERMITNTNLPSQFRWATIVDESLRVNVGASTVNINFNSGGWALVTSIGGPNVEVHIESAFDNGVFPIVLSFPHGKGRVFFTSFHHQTNNVGVVQHLLSTLALRVGLNINVEEIYDWADYYGYDDVAVVLGTLGYGQESEVFVPELQEGNEFAIVINSDLGNFQINLTAPNGLTFSNFVNGEFVTGPVQGTPTSAFSAASAFSAEEMTVVSFGVDGLVIQNPIANDDDDQWKFTVTSQTPGATPIPFVVGIAQGENPSAPQIFPCGNCHVWNCNCRVFSIKIFTNYLGEIITRTVEQIDSNNPITLLPLIQLESQIENVIVRFVFGATWSQIIPTMQSGFREVVQQVLG